MFYDGIQKKIMFFEKNFLRIRSGFWGVFEHIFQKKHKFLLA